MEIIRTYKLVVLGAIFLILGIMNPLTAKLTPTLLSSLVPEGMTIGISEPSAMDSWMKFYKKRFPDRVDSTCDRFQWADVG